MALLLIPVTASVVMLFGTYCIETDDGALVYSLLIASGDLFLLESISFY